MKTLIKSRAKLWGLVIVISSILLLFAQCGREDRSEEIAREQITVNAPQAMHKAFEETLECLKLDEKYEIKFTSNKDANFTVTTKESESNEFIAYSPIVAVFNEDEEVFQTYIDSGIFIQSDTEPEAYDFDFQKVMKDIIENPDSSYKVYYPDSTIGDWSVFYAFLLYTANDGCYPKDEANMAETEKAVEAFLQSKKTETISLESLDKIGGFSKNSIYFMSLADLGYIFENKKISCRVMFPKTTVYYDYYAIFDGMGEILYDALSKTDSGFLSSGQENIGYYYLSSYGNYFVKQYAPSSVSIGYYNSNTDRRVEQQLRDTFNAVEVPQTFINNKEE